MAIIKSKTPKTNFELNVSGIPSKIIDKSFGRPEDSIELHIYDLKDNLLYSDYKFRDFSYASFTLL